MKKKIKVAVVDDHPMIRQGLKLILESKLEFEVLFDAQDGNEVLEKLKTSTSIPDVILMDIDMPNKNGLDACIEVNTLYANTSVLFLTNHISKKYIETAILYGGRGYITKDSCVETMTNAIIDVERDGYYLNEIWSIELIQSLLKKGKIKHQFDLDVQLTTREIEILREICFELTDIQIAEKLFLSPYTVESYRKSLLKKIGVKKSVGLAIFAVKNNII